MADPVIPSCTNCDYSMWDKAWCEYKCLHYSRRLQDFTPCENYVLQTEEKDFDETYEEFE